METKEVFLMKMRPHFINKQFSKLEYFILRKINYIIILVLTASVFALLSTYNGSIEMYVAVLTYFGGLAISFILIVIHVRFTSSKFTKKCNEERVRVMEEALKECKIDDFKMVKELAKSISIESESKVYPSYYSLVVMIWCNYFVFAIDISVDDVKSFLLLQVFFALISVILDKTFSKYDYAYTEKQSLKIISHELLEFTKIGANINKLHQKEIIKEESN
ncbi:hypothetical protein EZV73_10215 [Acidaminobacter sp. JC074]|uniref:hypothetical protein n=1 Tax=Acidaminobacter sp. JC074 TaxID=2530199 RepID=UPI001F0FA6B6|nr:hypothetical protein [Acidaminobacter sp. JC074]MCH4887949.1 hypothetical protein [Acidaminobacter sp. JC074]